MQRKAMVNFTFSLLIFSIPFISLLQFSCPQKAYPNVSCIPRERRALLQFRNGLVDGSNRLSSWIGEDCCNWEGVGCNKKSGHVVKLDLRNPNKENGSFQGDINSSLLALKHLNYLDLSMNNFSGIQIPIFLGSLKNLKYLNLSLSGFMGNIPHNLGNLSHLQHLDLGSKYGGVTLAAKSISWVAKLSFLKSLDLSYVNLNGSDDWFQAINMLSSLVSLKLMLCELDYLPNPQHVNLTSLSLLDLSWNHFNSTIPLWLFNMTSLQYLDLSSNSFYGLVHDKISQLTSLTSLYLPSNDIGGSLPLEFLCNLTSLTALYLGFNKFQGPIPREIGCFRHVVELNLAGNELNGTIPSNLWLLTNLEFLAISSNSLIGEISEVHFAKLEKLKYLWLGSNSFTLNVSSSWIPPFQLEDLYMGSLKIGPRFPPWLQTQKNLNRLDMSNASISDEIPDWFEIVHSHIYFLSLYLNNITGKAPIFNTSVDISLSSNRFTATPYRFPSDTLDLSENLIEGPIPLPEDLSTTSLKFLFLNDNCFSGNIPESICHLRTLQRLDLSNNQLSGRLPLCLGNLQDLFVLNLANNSLHGQIPSSLGNIEFLQSLQLSKNKFDGKLPLSMQNLIYMQFLDLGENQLEGIIPFGICKHFSELRVLRIQSNNFYGEVPVHLCQLSKLHVLNLAQNNLTGFIPRCFNNFSAMVYNYLDLEAFAYGPGGGTVKILSGVEKLFSFMSGRELEYYSSTFKQLRSLDLSQNNIIGGIPNELRDLVGLNSLKLSKNHLSANIPDKIGNLKELLSLDLSTNELSGSIPQSLANLNFLNYLNLSSNKLSGRIPMGNQLQTLDDPSIYAGNNDLCGKPLSNNCSNDNSAPKKEHRDDNNFSWIYAGVGPGFVVGLLGIFCILFFKKSWRYAYFQFLENLADNMLVWCGLKTSKLRRKLPLML